MTARPRPAWLDRWFVTAAGCLVVAVLTIAVWTLYLVLGVARDGADFDPAPAALLVARVIGNGTFVVGLFCAAVWSARRIRADRPRRGR
ncbi:MAG: hypothetical protein PGN07_01215 [Aeromicrobium erythreum]